MSGNTIVFPLRTHTQIDENQLELNVFLKLSKTLFLFQIIHFMFIHSRFSHPKNKRNFFLPGSDAQFLLEKVKNHNYFFAKALCVIVED